MTDQATAHPEQVQRLFDDKASTWAAKYAPHGRLTGRLTQLADAVGYRVAAGGHVLDLGCGSGELSRHLAAAGLRVTGCDISPKMLARAAASDPTASSSWCGWRRTGGRCRSPRQLRRGRGVQRARVRPLPGAVLPSAPGCCGPAASCCAPCPTRRIRCAGWSGWPGWPAGYRGCVTWPATGPGPTDT